MKAIIQDIYGTADVLKFADIDEPVPGENQVKIRVRAAGVDMGVWHLMTGEPYLVRAVGYGLRKPSVPIRGRDVAGVVESVGAKVTQFKPGDEVFGTCEGSFAEFAVARQDRIAPKPAELSFEEAAAAPISGVTALQALRDIAGVQAGQSVLVIGAAGGVGSYAVQLAKALGAHVTGVCSTGKVELVRSLGADDVLDYTRTDVTDGSRQFDVIIDTAGNRPLSALRRTLVPRGTLVLVGGEGGGKLFGLMGRILRAALLNPFVAQRLRPFVSTEGQQHLQALSKFLADGSVRPAIDRTFALAEAAEAIRYIHAGKARGKVVVTF